MWSIRLSLACAAFLSLGVDAARAQFRTFASPNWWNGSPYYGMSPYYGGFYPGGMPWQFPGSYYSSWQYPTVQYSWIPASYGPVFDQSITRPARARQTLSPAVSYREMLAYETQNAALDDGTATFTVHLPANATLTINGKQMTQRGEERTFVTPKLPNKTQFYPFVFRASWRDELGARTQETTLQVRSGRSYTIMFPLPRGE